MNWLVDQLQGLFYLFLLVSLLLLVSSPFETLGWWSGWSRKQDRPREEPPLPPAAGSEGPFLVYLTGVAGFSGTFLSRRERGFLERVARRVPNLVIVDDIFPFSSTNNPLDGDRLFRWLWKWLHAWRLRVPNNVFDLLIIMRNICQVLVSADPRYGPVYNLGVAREVCASLSRQGYPAHRGVPVTLLAYSGGAQIAVGIAPYLRDNLGARVHLITLGGVITDDPGIAAVHRLLALQGERDHLLPALGWLLFPGRWPWLRASSWNRFRRGKGWEFRRCGPIRHVGANDYFSQAGKMPDGTLFADYLAELIAEELAR